MVHTLKTIQPHFENLLNGIKTFELRKDDRPYATGNVLLLKEYDLQAKTYSGREIKMTVTHVLRNAPEFGLLPGYCILSIKQFPTL